MNMQNRGGGFAGMPLIIKNLIIINALFFLATYAIGYSMNIDLIDKLGLHFPLAEKFKIWQPITHMFMHDITSIWHIAFNMFALWMFGTQIERVWGPQKFLTFYLITGLGAAFTHELVIYLEMRPVLEALDAFLNNPNAESMALIHSQMGYTGSVPLNPDPSFIQEQVNFFANSKREYLNQPVAIGASGAVYGVLLAFGMLYPNQQIMFIFPPIPIKAKYFVIILGLLALWSTSNDKTSNVAHAAHLGGMIFGFLLIFYWNRKSKFPKIFH